MKTLYLIRHSLTEANERRLYYGATDLPLSESGRQLCRQLRGSFSLPEGVCFATSGMLRAEETLKELFGGVTHEIYPALREMDQGLFEMHSYDELKDNPAYQSWLSDESGQFRIPGGETNAEFFARTSACARELMRLPIDDLFIVCHGGTIGSVMQASFPDAGKSFYDWIRHACQGYAIRIENEEPVSWTPI